MLLLSRAAIASSTNHTTTKPLGQTSVWTVSFTVPVGAQILSATKASRVVRPTIDGRKVLWRNIPLVEGTKRQRKITMRVRVNIGTANLTEFKALATSMSDLYNVYSMPYPLVVSKLRFLMRMEQVRIFAFVSLICICLPHSIKLNRCLF
jgi:hypothetical protein|eukprot:evm.model.NODE_26024_length_17010_cov_77.754318.5